MEDTTVTILTDYEEKYWNQNPHPAVRFFLEHNDAYLEGQALASFFPINLKLFSAIAMRKSSPFSRLYSIWQQVNPKAAQRTLRRKLASSLFAEWVDPGDIERMAPHLQSRHLKPGETLINQGERQDSIYILLHGAVVIAIETEAGEVIISQLAPGEYVGEISTILQIETIATVRAVGRCELAVIGPRALNALPQHGKAIQNFRAIIDARMAETSGKQDQLSSPGRD